jgi:lysozyme
LDGEASNGHVMTRLGAALIALAAIAALGAGAIAIGWWTPWAGGYVQGVDVSWHQGAIDWNALARTDVKFVYIKATEGADRRDARFDSNWRGAGEAGLKRGAYHYFTLCRPAAAQAANFIAAVPVAPDALPPAVDVEQKRPCRRSPQIADVPGELTRYLDLVEAHYGVRPIVYTTQEFHDAHLKGALKGERFWLRSLFGRPEFRRDAWVIWQHHNGARRRGVQGPVDLNRFRGDEAGLAAFAGAPAMAGAPARNGRT